MTVVRDTSLVFRRSLRLLLRNPVWVMIGVFQPVLYLALYGPLLEQLVGTRGFTAQPGTNAWQVFVPGLLIQLGLFGSAFVGFAIIAEVRNGVVERMRVTPVSRTALLLGRVLRDALVLLVQGSVLVIVGLAFGLRAPWLGVVCGLGLVALLGITMSSLSYAAGLVLKSEDALAPLLNTIVVPLLLLSGILLPMSLAPTWLYDISRINPFSYSVDALRDLFSGEYATGHVLAGVIATSAVAVAGIAVGTRTFQAENA